MHWIAPSEKNADHAALEKRLWDAADQLLANPQSTAEVRFTARELEAKIAGNVPEILGA